MGVMIEDMAEIKWVSLAYSLDICPLRTVTVARHGSEKQGYYTHGDQHAWREQLGTKQ